MNEQELQNIGRRVDMDSYPRDTDALIDALYADVRALIAEVRRLRELIDDNVVLYLTPEERQEAQRRYNALTKQYLDSLPPQKL